MAQIIIDGLTEKIIDGLCDKWMYSSTIMVEQDVEVPYPGDTYDDAPPVEEPEPVSESQAAGSGAVVEEKAECCGVSFPSPGMLAAAIVAAIKSLDLKVTISMNPKGE